MKPHGMLFKAEMILALLNTKVDVWPAEAIDATKPHKWQTRRGLNPQPPIGMNHLELHRDGTLEVGSSHDSPNLIKPMRCPHRVGQIIYAQETFMPDPYIGPNVIYRATEKDPDRYVGNKWKPSIFMPKSVARVWLKVVKVRVERVNQISEADAKAEGVPASETVEMKDGSPCYTLPYQILFDRINGTGAFHRGDWCWVYDLARISKPDGTR